MGHTVKQLSFHNVMEIIQHALLYEIEEIVGICLSFLSENFSSIGKVCFESVESELFLQVIDMLLERGENGFDEWCAVTALLIFMVSKVDLRSMTAVEFGECVQNIVTHVKDMKHSCSTTIVRISFRKVQFPPIHTYIQHSTFKACIRVFWDNVLLIISFHSTP
jgi:hypothetical protein